MTELYAHSYASPVSKVVLVQILFIFGSISSSAKIDSPCGQLSNPAGNTPDQKIFPPWSAIIKKEYDSTRNQLKIAGVIVAPNLIMSSAFYFVSNSSIMTISPYKYFEVTVGSHVWVPGVAGGEVKKFKISHITLHPKHSMGTFWSNTRNDQILFHITEPVNISELVQPICLPTNQQIMDLILLPGGENPPPIITGWTQNYPDEFYLDLDLKSKSECAKRWKDLEIPDVYQNRFCATVSEDNNQTKCVRRDVATMRRIDDKFYLAGQMNQLFSHNFTCTPGSLYFFNMFNMETFSWIRDTIRCGPSNFTCGTGKCIPLYKQCNRYRECPDGSDEVADFCRYLYKCPEGEFYCGASENDICIPDAKVNDGVKDCPNGEDEFDLVLTPGKILFGTILAILTLVVGGYALQEEIRKERKYARLRDEEDAIARRQRLASTPWKSDPSLVHVRQIGKGTFPTTVHEAHDLNQTPYAVKCVSIQHTLQHNQENLPSISSAPVEDVILLAVNLLFNEIEVLDKLRESRSCDNIVRYYGCWAEIEGSAQVVSRAELQAYVGQSVTGVLPPLTSCNTPLSHIFIKMELCDFTLQHYLYPEINQPVIDRNQDITLIAKGIISGLAYIHERQYIHADIKPGNIFCKALSSQDGYTWKIGDFGLAMKMMPNGIEGAVGTETYKSPEMLEGQRYADKTDVYSLGLVFVELVQQHGSMFRRVDAFNVIRNCHDDEERLRYIGGELAIGLYSRFVEVINTMLKENPDERPSSEELKGVEF